MSDGGVWDFAKDLLSRVSAPTVWLTRRTNRQRLRGARVEAVSVLIRTGSMPSMLLVKSVYEDCWMFPQEGVNLGESLLSASVRGLDEECGLTISGQGSSLIDGVHRRDIRYVGILDLPPDRWGERSVASNANDGPLSQVTLKRKAYWAIFYLVDEATSLTVQPNMVEVVDAAWIPLDEIPMKLRNNREAKRVLLMLIARRGVQHLRGARVAKHWSTLGPTV